VPSKNSFFGDATIGQKTIGRLGVCPVLANQRNALTSAVGELLEESSESLVKPDVLELATGKFTINPCVGLGDYVVINPQRVVRLLPFGHSRSFTVRRPCAKLMLSTDSSVQPIR